MAEAREAVRRRLLQLGFDEVRFADLADRPADGLTPWIAQGHHADMAWMERSAPKRLSPELVLPGARSAVLLGVNYLRPARGRGPAWARYSLYRDYHDTVKEALVRAGRVLEEELGAGPEDYRYYVDTGPVLERAWAAQSGVGFIGKNAMLISRRHGNWLFLAAILLRQALPADAPARVRGKPSAVGLLCGKCTRCLDACPTGAFPAPGVVDARRCISYQTIENKGVIPRELRAGIGDRVYGCDTCLEVCPWNRFARQGRAILLEANDAPLGLTLRELLELTPARFAAVFKGTAIKRLKLTGLLRNACVVAGNTGDPSHLPALAALAGHPSALVRAHAVWAVRRLGGDSLLASTRPAESDPWVLEEYLAPRTP